MKIVFMGTPDFAVPSLKALAARHEVAAVITQPDKPAGRSKKIRFSPVKTEALSLNIPVLQPEKVRNAEFIEKLQKFNADIFVVAAYGQLLPVTVLNMPPLGCVNVHGSLLPKYRGAAPIQWAILNGEEKTGITIIQMDKGIDTGDMILKRELTISPDDTGGSLHDKMAILGSEALLAALEMLQNRSAVKERQDDAFACYAPKLTKETGRICWQKNTADILNMIRGLNPWPTAYTNDVKILAAEKHTQALKGMPGQILDTIANKGIVVATGDGAILITRLQAEGGRAMLAADYIRGHAIEIGKILV